MLSTCCNRLRNSCLVLNITYCDKMHEASHSEVTRCAWLNKDPLYIAYHDEEWGKPQYDSIKLFEMLCLEGQQAGLSWITILKKREHYRKVFCKFNPQKISQFTEEDVTRLLSDPGIVRHRGKIKAIINNSKCFVKMKAEGQNFSDFIWSFVNHNPIINSWNEHNKIPTETVTSITLSKALKARGFKYVGSTICYAFMQACGLVDDHLLSCVSHSQNK